MTHLLNIFGKALALSSLLMCTACGASTHIESAKVPDYNKVPARVLVFLPVGLPQANVVNGQAVLPNPAEAKLSDAFDEIFLKYMTRCNIAAQTNNESQKIGNRQEPTALIASYNPDWVITVVATNKTSVSRGFSRPMVVGATYNVTATDQKDNQKIWRANVSVPMQPGLISSAVMDPGHDLATAIINQMRTDGLLTACPALQQ